MRKAAASYPFSDLALAARLAQTDRIQGLAEVLHARGRGLREHIAGRDGPLRPVAQQNYAQHALPGFLAEHFVQRVADRRLSAVGDLGHEPRAAAARATPAAASAATAPAGSRSGNGTCASARAALGRSPAPPRLWGRTCSLAGLFLGN